MVDEVVCFILLRLSFNCLRNAWLPGGYPPKKDASKVWISTDSFCLLWFLLWPVAEAHPLQNYHVIIMVQEAMAAVGVSWAGPMEHISQHS